MFYLEEYGISADFYINKFNPNRSFIGLISQLINNELLNSFILLDAR